MNAVAIEAECQHLESVLARLKAGDIAVSVELLDELHHQVDSVEERLAAASNAAPQHSIISAGQSALPSAFSAYPPGNPPLIGAPNPFSAESAIPPKPSVGQKQSLYETLRISAEKLDSLLRQTEELLPMKSAAQERTRELRDICNALSSWEAQWRKLCSGPLSAAVIAVREGAAPRSADFMEKNKTTLALMGQRLAGFLKLLEIDRRALERHVDDLAEDARQLSMIPVSTLLESFPKLVRDLCRDCGKEAELVIAGGELETDRKILEEVKDALGAPSPQLRRPRRRNSPKARATRQAPARDHSLWRLIAGRWQSRDRDLRRRGGH